MCRTLVLHEWYQVLCISTYRKLPLLHLPHRLSDGLARFLELLSFCRSVSNEANGSEVELFTLSRNAVKTILNIMVPCVRLYTTALRKKDCKIRRFLSFEVFHPKVWNQFKKRGTPSRQALGPNIVKI